MGKPGWSIDEYLARGATAPPAPTGEDDPDGFDFREVVGDRAGISILVASDASREAHLGVCSMLHGGSGRPRRRRVVAGSEVSPDCIDAALPPGETRDPDHLQVVVDDVLNRTGSAARVPEDPAGFDAETVSRENVRVVGGHDADQLIEGPERRRRSLAEFGAAIADAIDRLQAAELSDGDDLDAADGADVVDRVGMPPRSPLDDVVPDGVLRVCVRDLDTLLSAYPEAAVYDLVDALSRRVDRSRGVLHLHLPRAPRADEADRIRELVDVVAEVRTTPAGTEYRWLADGRRSAWMPTGQNRTGGP